MPTSISIRAAQQQLNIIFLTIQGVNIEVCIRYVGTEEDIQYALYSIVEIKKYCHNCHGQK